MRFYYFIFLSILVHFSSIIYSQTDCLYFYKSCEEYDGKRYEYDDNCGGFYLTADETLEVDFEAFQGIEYTVSVCTDSISLPLNYTIESLDSLVLYDNSEDNYAASFNFSVPQNRQLRIKVKIDNDCVENVTVCKGCVGIIIQKKVKPRTGF